MTKRSVAAQRDALEIRRVTPADELSLADIFEAIVGGGDAQYFHPHPLTKAEAHRLAHYEGQDLYYVAADGTNVQAYGMLRGWDEGYAIPSLGIIVHPAARGHGLGKLLMLFLHAAARTRGAKKIRLKVYRHNLSARQLYEHLGYRFDTEEQGQIVGLLDLS